ncbi:phage protein [Streptococcus pneumoniae]|nr:phage protein [Streptococcus pneumoniae]VLU69015.1 phage protein [Streptococcus pneumoniae]VMJ58504.1 phage protein [Streptococcus pneumoniae]
MKIEELIGDYERVSNFCEKVSVDKLIQKLKQLDEPQKVTIPQFVADFITEQKKLGHTLSYSIDASMSDRVAEWYWDNSELFALAWIFGYEVEKEKRYLVKVKGVFKGYEYLNFKFGRVWTFSNEEENEEYRTCHTKKELEEAGFGWIFSCEGIEVEEVE